MSARTARRVARLLPADDAPNEGCRALRIHGRRIKRRVLAEQLNRPIGTVQQWFSARRMPDADSRALLEDVLGIPAGSWELARAPAPPEGPLHD